MTNICALAAIDLCTKLSYTDIVPDKREWCV